MELANRMFDTPQEYHEVCKKCIECKKLSDELAEKKELELREKRKKVTERMFGSNDSTTFDPCIECKKQSENIMFYSDVADALCNSCWGKMCQRVDDWDTIENCFYCNGKVEWRWDVFICEFCRSNFCVNCRTEHIRDHFRKYKMRQALDNVLLGDILSMVEDMLINRNVNRRSFIDNIVECECSGIFLRRNISSQWDHKKSDQHQGWQKASESDYEDEDEYGELYVYDLPNPPPMEENPPHAPPL